MRTSGNKDLFILMGSKGDGKTTVATYLMHRIDQPTVIIDVARQFDENDYRIVTTSISEFKYYLLNPVWNRAFRMGSIQIVFRPSLFNAKKQIEKVCNILLTVPNILIYFEEMEIYADGYLNKNSSIFQLVYLMRNHGHTIIVVAKQASKLSSLIKDLGDYFFLGNLESKSSLRFFDDWRGSELTEQIKRTPHQEFLIVGRRGFSKPFKLDPKIARMIK